MNYPPSHPKYLPPRKHWLERKGIVPVQPVTPLPLTGWISIFISYGLILLVGRLFY